MPTAGEDIDHLPDFDVASADRIDAACAGVGGEIDGESFQRRAGCGRGMHLGARCRGLFDRTANAFGDGIDQRLVRNARQRRTRIVNRRT